MSDAPCFDVLGLGALAVDDLLYVDAYPPPDQKVRVHQRDRQCGGLTGTALVAAARLGSRCAYVGALGEEVLSRLVQLTLSREGIDLDHAARRADAQPAHSTIIVDRTHKTRNIFASQDGFIGADPSLPPAELILAAKVLLIDHHGLEGTLRAVRIARSAGVAVVADFERDPGPPFGEIVELVDHLILSERFARQWTGVEEPVAAVEALWSPGRAVVAVTCGASGCWYRDRSGAPPRHIEAFPVTVVDTTGCGDVFHGAYCAGLVEGRTPGSCLALASAAAALKATQPGGQSGIPTRREVDAFLRRATT